MKAKARFTRDHRMPSTKLAPEIVGFPADGAGAAGAVSASSAVATVREFDPEVVGKLNGQPVGNVLNDTAAAHLGQRPGQLDVAVESDMSAGVAGADFVGDLGTGAAAALAVDALGLDMCRMRASVDIDDGGFTLERCADGAKLDLDPTFVAGRAGLADQLEAGHAGDHLRNLLEEIPDALDRLVDIERGLDVGHGGAAFVRWECGAEPKGKG